MVGFSIVILLLVAFAALLLFRGDSGRGLVHLVTGGLLGLNLLIVLGSGTLVWFNSTRVAEAAVQQEEGEGSPEETAEGLSAGVAIGASLAAGLASIGAGIAVGLAGAAAIGAITEKPEVLGRSLIFVGLAEGIAIYGLIVAFMILTGGLGD